MPSIILSDNGVSSGSAGYKITSGNDGVLILQTTTSGGTATNAIYVDNNQNIGLGTTPSGWYSTSSQALQFGVGATYSHTYSGTTGYGIAYNTYSSSVGGGWKYVANGYAHIFEQSDAYQTLYSSDSGTAGASVSSLTQTLALGKGVSLSLQGATPKTGTGITFPATQNASSNVKTLDDYEEGTWTPTLVATGYTFTYAYQIGLYTKIGNLVTFKLYMVASFSTGSGTVQASISGLPFTASSSTANFGGVSVNPDTGSAYLTTGGYTMTARTGPSTTGLYFQVGNGGNAPKSTFNWAGMTAGTEFEISGHYYTT